MWKVPAFIFDSINSSIPVFWGKDFRTWLQIKDSDIPNLFHSVVGLESGLGLLTHRTWTRYQRTRTQHLWTWEFTSSPVRTVRVHHLNVLVDILIASLKLVWPLLPMPPVVKTTQIALSVRVSSLIFQRSFSRQEYMPIWKHYVIFFATKFERGGDHMIYILRLFNY
jgi:hypothetical protein